MIILLFFAAFGSIGFLRSLVALLWMAAILSAVVGALRREPPFDTDLNHWDETIAYAALCSLVPSSPIRQTWANPDGPSPSRC